LENEKEFLCFSARAAQSSELARSCLPLPFALPSCWAGRFGVRAAVAAPPSLSQRLTAGPTCRRPSPTSARSLGRSRNRRPLPHAHVLCFVGASHPAPGLQMGTRTRRHSPAAPPHSTLARRVAPTARQRPIGELVRLPPWSAAPAPFPPLVSPW
jgi:hypothetical protein